MKDKTLEKANEIKNNLKAIEKTRHILCRPYPNINDNDRLEVSFICFDDITRALIKKSIRDILDKREKELEKEFEQL